MWITFVRILKTLGKLNFLAVLSKSENWYGWLTEPQARRNSSFVRYGALFFISTQQIIFTTSILL